MHKLTLILILILSSQQIFACSCIGKSTIKNDIKSSRLIFKGKVLEKKIITVYVSDTLSARNFYDNLENKKIYKSYEDFKKSIFGKQLLEYTIEKIDIYKGKRKSNIIRIRTGFGSGDCGYKFEINKTYLIFANNSEYLQFSTNHKPKWRKLKNVFETNICMRTKLFDNATKNELSKLKKL